MLGCSNYDVWLMNRGATRMIKQLRWTSLEWNRNIDDISLGNVALAGIQGAKGVYCCDDAHLIIPWEHEIAIFRNGKRAWAGPVLSKAATDVGYTVNCRDLMVWTKRRRLHHTHDHVNTDLSAIFNMYVNDAMAPDNSMGLVVLATPCGIPGTRLVRAEQYKQAWPELDEISRTGVDWTVIDRAVIVGGSELDEAPIATLTDASFVDIDEYQVDGQDLVTDAITIGDGVGEAGATVVGRCTGGDTARYGVHELVYQESSIRDARSAERNARTRWDLDHEPAKVFTGGTLSQEAEIDLDELIPGRIVNLSISDGICDSFLGRYRLASVQGSAGPEHDRISIKVQPLGTTAGLS